jgi:5-carboxymethyl-2-hydroxymuconate isomerase
VPHINIEYSANLESEIDFVEFCTALRTAAMETGLFPLTGVRIRAFRCDHALIADGNPENSFVDMSVRLRGGRTLEDRQAATQSIFDAAVANLRELIDARPIAVSLEMRDVDPDLSPKLNTMKIMPESVS